MFRAPTIYLLCFLMLVSPSLSSAAEPFNFARFFRKKRPANTAVVQLARTLDELEKKLNLDGTVVAKAPDIWGEARLTKHRQEFEREMAKEVEGFEFRINAAIARSDQAFLASALALTAIGPGVELSNGQPTNSPSAVLANQASGLLPGLPTQQVNPDQPAPAPTASTQQIIFNTPLRGLVDEKFSVKSKAINIEPEIYLDQKARYLNHLHEIRRINEGDDTADSPGYSMNLVRVPISVLPGSYTQKNHGAEVTITATPHVTDELLPITFRQLVINDIVDQLAPVVRKFAEELPRLDTPLASQQDGKFEALSQFFEETPYGVLVRYFYGKNNIAQQLVEQTARSGTYPTLDDIAPSAGLPEELRSDFFGAVQQPKTQRALEKVPGAREQLFNDMTERDFDDLILNVATSVLDEMFSQIGQQIYSVAPQILHTSVGSFTRRSRQPISSSQIPFAFGVHELLSLSYDFRNRVPEGEMIHLSDVRAYLQEELEAAYDFTTVNGQPAGIMLSDPEIVLSDGYSGKSLTALLRTNTHASVKTVFEQRVAVTNQFSRAIEYVNNEEERKTLHLPSVTTSLAWAVVVESLLLNQRLNEDIRHVSKDPECGCMCPGDLVFCGSTPDPQAREVFADYVKCRWPVHVFALDPQSQDQNVADSFSMRREMQLALALAFSGGQISAQKMTRYVRRLEMDMETIALNRTAAAFGHGRDVFGWRFYPRVQTPPFESTSTTVFRDLLGGGPGKDALRRSWEIEPGMRECTAIVLMPSFITHLTFDIRGNYFPLGRNHCHEPSDTRISIEDNMEMSHKIRLMENATCSIASEANCYRDGEVQRLMRRADQLAKKLPLQTVHARVPNENMLGGFEMFSSGVTDLAPELLDFYGQPGVDPRKDTVFFLVGNNFSVHDTQVLAGNKNVAYDLISRQVMKVTIPSGVQAIDKTTCRPPLRCEQPSRVVDVHIATPYGVSQHLEIPVIGADDCCSTSGYRWSRENLSATYTVKIKKNTAPEADRLSEEAEDSTVFMAPPFLLEIQVPPGNFRHAAKAKLSVVMTSPDLGLSARVKTASASDDTLTAIFNPDTKTYQIRDAVFVNLQKEIREEVIKWVNAIKADASKKPANYEIKLNAVLTPSTNPTPIPPIPLDNSLTMDIRINPKP